MFFVFPSAVYPRKPVERVFKALYQLGNITHVISLVVLMTEFYVRLQTSIPDYFTSSRVSVAPGIAMVMEDCNYNGTIHVGRLHTDTSIGGNSIPGPLLLMAQHILLILIVQLLAILNNAISLANYSSGNRHLRILGVHIPLYHILTVFSFVYCIVLIILVWAVRPTRDFYSTAITTCAEQLKVSNSARLLEAEYDDYNIFSAPIEWAFASAVVNLFMYVTGAIVLTFHSHNPATVLLSESNVPWEERGVGCMTNKAALRIHTTARDAILAEARAAIERGEKVRIMRSYALVTEADYQEQVEAMRQRFAERVRNEQFEQLRTYFERESDIDEEGLLWRRQAPAPPPPPPNSQQQRPLYPTEELDDYVHYGNTRGDDDGGGGGETFVNIFEEREHDDRMWSELDKGAYDEYNNNNNNFDNEIDYDDDDDYIVSADDGGELAGVPSLDTSGHRHRRRRRHRHHRENNNIEENMEEAVIQPAEEPLELREILIEEESNRAEAPNAAEDILQHRHHHRRRRRRHRSHSQADRDGELEGAEHLEEVASPLEDADEL